MESMQSFCRAACRRGLAFIGRLNCQPIEVQFHMQVALPMSELMESLNAGVVESLAAKARCIEQTPLCFNKAGGILMHALTCAWTRQF